MITDATRGTVQRLANYRSVLVKLRNLGFVRVFSDNLGDALGISASQVRKDFSQFDLRGNRRGGYQVDALLLRLNEILGKNELQKVIVVGCGKIGTALMTSPGFSSEGIKVVAGFDVDPGIINPQGQLPIYDAADLTKVVEQKGIKVAIMTVPESAAGNVFEQLLSAGIRAVLNFTPVQLRGNGHNCIIQNVSIEREIENLFYFVKLSEISDGGGPAVVPVAN